MLNKYPWYCKGGPKNNGRFGIIINGHFEIGRNHKPMTRINRARLANKPKKGFKNA